MAISGELYRTAEVRNLFDVTAAHLGYAYALSGRLPEGIIFIEEAVADPEATGTAYHQLLLAYLGEETSAEFSPRSSTSIGARMVFSMV